MMTPIVPPVVIERILAFLGEQKTGQIVVHVKSGQVMQIDANEITKVRPEQGPH